MNLFTPKNILQKIIISILVVILLFEFITPNISRASKEGFAGVLFTPVQQLVAGLGDSIMHIMGQLVAGQQGDSILHLETESNVKLVGKYIFNCAMSWFHPIKSYVDNIKIIKQLSEEGIFPDKFDVPIYLVTPEKIFSDEVPFLNANIINPKEYSDYKDKNGNDKETPAMQFKSIISTWYIALRNLAIVIMLSVLLYIGIRIIISSTANSKVKYKEMLVDWLIGMFLIFFMHYIMAFAFSMTEMLTSTIKQSIQYPALQLNLSKYKESADEDTEKALKQIGGMSDSETLDWSNVKITTDFTGMARIYSQLEYSNVDGEDRLQNNEVSYMGYTIIFAVMVMYTVMFTWKYLKRLIYMIFLIMISPLIALSYPLDKMNDGSAQAFNMWIKEFIFTLLIQPFHLLLYTVLIGSAITMATDNMIYALVVLGFMLPAEKILKKFFGFDRKAPIGEGAMGGAVGGAIAMQAINGISKGVKNIKGIASKGGNGSSGGNNRIRTQEQPAAISDRTADQGADAEDEYMNEAFGLTGIQNAEGSNDSEQSVAEVRRQQLSEANGNSEANNNLEENTIEPELVNKMGVNVNVPEMKDMNGKNTNAGNVPNVDIKLQEPKEEKPKAFSKAKVMANKAFTKVKNSRVGAAASVVAPSLGRGAKNVGKAVLAGVPTAIVAGTGATIGVAAGLASDDYTNVLKYGLAGAGAGAGVGLTGAKVVGGVASTAYRKIPNGVREINAKYYQNQGKERYQEYLNKQSDKAFMKSKEVKEQYQKAFGEQYKEVMEKAMEYRKHGVTDNEVIIKAMKSKAKGVGKDYADSKRIAAAKLAKNVNNEKDVETIGNRLKDRGVSETQIRQQKEMLRDIRGLF